MWHSLTKVNMWLPGVMTFGKHVVVAYIPLNNVHVHVHMEGPMNSSNPISGAWSLT